MGCVILEMKKYEHLFGLEGENAGKDGWARDEATARCAAPHLFQNASERVQLKHSHHFFAERYSN